MLAAWLCCCCVFLWLTHNWLKGKLLMFFFPFYANHLLFSCQFLHWFFLIARDLGLGLLNKLCEYIYIYIENTVHSKGLINEKYYRTNICVWKIASGAPHGKGSMKFLCVVFSERDVFFSFFILLCIYLTFRFVLHSLYYLYSFFSNGII